MPEPAGGAEIPEREQKRQSRDVGDTPDGWKSDRPPERPKGARMPAATRDSAPCGVHTGNSGE
ncbi:hypothetical protein GCM10018773_21520 [Streptomyces candidus]|nr:hypothetical protein GCM10018773_21520 [Streptomyces candidus]